MRGPLRQAALGGAVLIALLLAAAPATARIPKPFFGVIAQGGVSNAEFQKMHGGRVGTLRFGISWAAVHPTQSGEAHWGGVDNKILGAARHGVQVLPAVFGTPTWVQPCPHSPDYCRFKPPLATHLALHRWQGFLRQVAHRYGPGGTLWSSHQGVHAAPIKRVQIWNEQNAVARWKPKPSARAYGRLLKASSHAIRAVNPRTDILVGGMFGTPAKARSITAWGFLSRLYHVKRAKSAFDGVSLHPYSPNLAGIRYQVTHTRHALQSHHDGSTPLYVTEIGWGSGRNSNRLTKGRRGQAHMLRRSFQLFLHHRRAWHLRSVIWFSWKDHSTGVCSNWCATAGLFNQSLQAKPSWGAYKSFTRKTG